TTQKKITLKQVNIIRLIESNPQISTEELAIQLGITRDGVNWHIRQMKAKGLLERVGPDKGGYWRIIDK
ncbi:MAG: winged helix-turn-helix transcriptional regulator, partial [Bacteroidales bacterium]|nr:winged helix-turn-helix transcriptional regulator [Bacteroidales bacterium]